MNPWWVSTGLSLPSAFFTLIPASSAASLVALHMAESKFAGTVITASVSSHLYISEAVPQLS